MSQVLAEIAETDRGWGLGKGAPFPKPRPQGANRIRHTICVYRAGAGAIMAMLVSPLEL